MKKEARYLIVDASGYIYRAFHALPDLRTPDQFPTGALVGFVNMLEKTLSRFKPDAVAIVFDPPSGRSWRHDLYDAYKANRDRMPDDLVVQIEPIKHIVDAMGLKRFEIEGQEADDVIASLAKQTDVAVIIASSDKDLMQLVDERVNLIHPMTDKLIDTEAVEAKFGVKPTQMRDYLALVGDTSDHVPGVDKVGPKTAAKWLNQYGDIDQLLVHQADIKGKVGDSLRSANEQVRLAQSLVKLDETLGVDWSDCEIKAPDHVRLYQLFKQFNFKRQMEKYKDGADMVADQTASSQPTAMPTLALIQVADMPSFSAAWAKIKKEDHMAVYETPKDHDDLLSSAKKYFVMGQTVIELADGLSDWLSVTEVVAPWLQDPNHTLIGHDLKANLNALNLKDLPCQLFDTMLAHYVLASHQAGQNSLADLLSQYLSLDDALLTDEQRAYGVLSLADVLEQKLVEHEVKALFTTLEMPVMRILQAMEKAGVCVDAQELMRQTAQLDIEINELEKRVFATVGQTFNLSSPKQLQTILYDQLQLPVLQKTPKGQPSTSEPALEQLALQHEIVRDVLRHRSLLKLKNTYTDKLPGMIHPVSGRIHAHFNQAVTSTGRLSSSEPNLQNIPIRTREGRLIRKAFVAKPGCQLICADYSQIELRIMAHLSQDPKLLKAFEQHQDIHAATAMEVFSVEHATDELRRRAKAINFGLIYGMSAFGLAGQLGVTRQEAQSFIDVYFERYPGVLTYMEQTRALAHAQGYVETIRGRRLYVLGINDRNFNRRQAAERAAINAPMQGSAADIIKQAMININRVPGALELQVHDELVFEVPDALVDDAVNAIRDAMVSAATLSVPLEVNIGVGPNWLDAK